MLLIIKILNPQIVYLMYIEDYQIKPFYSHPCVGSEQVNGPNPTTVLGQQPVILSVAKNLAFIQRLIACRGDSSSLRSSE